MTSELNRDTPKAGSYSDFELGGGGGLGTCSPSFEKFLNSISIRLASGDSF